MMSDNNKMNADDKIVIDRDSKDDSGINFFYLIGIFFRYWKILFSITFITGVLSIIYVLAATPIYQSYVSIYPVTQDQGGPLKELAITLGMTNKNDGFYLSEVMESRRITKKVIYHKYKVENYQDSINLIQFFELDDIDLSENRKYEATSKVLKGAINIDEDKETSLVVLKVATKDKFLCKQIAEVYCEAVQTYIQSEQKSQISYSIDFTIERLKEVRVELREAEDDLVKFQEANAKTVSASLSTELKRKFKKVELLQNVVVLLEKQAELLKIEEYRQKPVINILDHPDAVDKPIKPQKRRVVIFNTFVIFILTFVLIILREKAIKYNFKNELLDEINKTHT